MVRAKFLPEKEVTVKKEDRQNEYCGRFESGISINLCLQYIHLCMCNIHTQLGILHGKVCLHILPSLCALSAQKQSPTRRNELTQYLHIDFQILFSNIKKQDYLDKWFILGWGWRKYKMNLNHLEVVEGRDRINEQKNKIKTTHKGNISKGHKSQPERAPRGHSWSNQNHTINDDSVGLLTKE